MTWERFKRAFLEKYFPQSARAAKEAEFLELKQGNLTVSAYAAKLESLAKYFRFFVNNVNEEYLCTRFVDGLKFELKRAVKPLRIHQFQELVEATKEIEAMDSEKKEHVGAGGPIRNNQEKFNKGKKPYQRPAGKGKGSEQNRYSGGKFNNQGNLPPLEEITCFKCNQKGHYANSCPEGAVKCWNC